MSSHIWTSAFKSERLTPDSLCLKKVLIQSACAKHFCSFELVAVLSGALMILLSLCLSTGKEFNGNVIKVSFATRRPEFMRGGGGGGRRGETKIRRILFMK